MTRRQPAARGRIAAVLLVVAALAGCGSGAGTGASSGAGSAASPAASSATASPQGASRPADVVVVATPAGTSVRIARNETVRVVWPTPASGVDVRYEVQPLGSPTLMAAGAAGLFVAAAPGTVTVLVTQTPACPTGQACPAHVVALGSVRVTVTS